MDLTGLSGHQTVKKKKALHDWDNMAYKSIIALSLSQQLKISDLYSESC